MSVSVMLAAKSRLVLLLSLLAILFPDARGYSILDFGYSHLFVALELFKMQMLPRHHV